MRVEPLLTCPPTRPRRTAREDLREAVHDLAKGQAAILSHSERAWASVTFTGTRHRLALEFAGAKAIDAGEWFIARLAEHEFDIPSQLVADAAVTEVDHRLQPQRMLVTCELLLLDEA